MKLIETYEHIESQSKPLNTYQNVQKPIGNHRKPIKTYSKPIKTDKKLSRP